MVAKIRVLAWNIDGPTYLDGSSHQAATDFAASNPNGPWSYGYSVAGGTAAYHFIPFDNNTNPRELISGIAWWRSDYNHSGTPAAWRNTGSAVQFGGGPGATEPAPRPSAER